MSAATRYRIRERYWTTQEIADEAGLTIGGVWSRIRAGVTGEALLQDFVSVGQELIER